MKKSLLFAVSATLLLPRCAPLSSEGGYTSQELESLARKSEAQATDDRSWPSPAGFSEEQPLRQRVSRLRGGFRPCRGGLRGTQLPQESPGQEAPRPRGQARQAGRRPERVDGEDRKDRLTQHRGRSLRFRARADGPACRRLPGTGEPGPGKSSLISGGPTGVPFWTGTGTPPGWLCRPAPTDGPMPPSCSEARLTVPARPGGRSRHFPLVIVACRE